MTIPAMAMAFALRDDAATSSKSNEYLLYFDNNHSRHTTVAVNEMITSVDHNYSPEFRNVKTQSTCFWTSLCGTIGILMLMAPSARFRHI